MLGLWWTGGHIWAMQIAVWCFEKMWLDMVKKNYNSMVKQDSNVQRFNHGIINHQYRHGLSPQQWWYLGKLLGKLMVNCHMSLTWNKAIWAFFFGDVHKTELRGEATQAYADCTSRLRWAWFWGYLRGGYAKAKQGYADHTFCLRGRRCSLNNTKLIWRWLCLLTIIPVRSQKNGHMV